MKRFSILSLVFMLAAFMVACNDEDDQPMILNQSIVEIALETDDVSTLVQALQTANLVEALQGPGPFTVFAPTNAAFENLLASNSDWNSLADIPTDLLATVLTLHVVEGRIAAATLSEGTMLETLNGEQLTITGVDPVRINESASVISADIAGSNGIIHLIDAVLLPEMDMTPTLETRMSDDFGTVLTDQAGRTLYFFAPDVNGENNCSGGCADNWPIFFAEELNLDGVGDEALIGTIETENGPQTTYNGWPLYYFAGDDMMPNTFNGDGVGDNWFVAKPDYTLMVAVGQLVGADGNNYVEEDGMIVAGDGNSRFFVDFASGRTLYRFINDEENTSNFGGNPEIWPAFATPVTWVPSTVSVDEFMEITAGQISFRGNPLYKFGQDAERGETLGVSVPNPGVWPTVNENTPVLGEAAEMAITITLGNIGASAYTVEGVEGAAMEDVITGDPQDNPTLNLVEGQRYTFVVTNMSVHPLDFRDADNNVLLAFNATVGSFEEEAAVNFQTEGDNTLSFTLTSELAEVISVYVCTAHAGSMRGDINVLRD